MAIKVTVFKDEGARVVTISEPVTKKINVLAGRPGVQNLYVGATPPANPEEGFVWIDTNG